jgi:hypothetical protein
MKPARPAASLEQQFPHLRRELSKKTGWKTPTLAVLATISAVVLSATLLPVMDAARDFRKGAVPAATPPADGFELVRWADLVPKGWNPSHRIRELRERHAGLADADPRARAMLAQVREVLDAAPTEPSLAGRKVRIPGYVVPLGGRTGGMSEFLLVPHFGACIHTPPPAANQVVHVVSKESVGGLAAMDTVWVRGTLGIARHESEAAVSGYRLTDASVEPYQASPKQQERP